MLLCSGPDGNNLTTCRHLYKKSILALRGIFFRPRFKYPHAQKSYILFVREQSVEEENTIVVFENTLSNLKASGENMNFYWTELNSSVLLDTP